MSNKERKLLFEIEGEPTLVKKLLKKTVQRNYIAVYDAEIFTDWCADPTILKSEQIYDIYIKEPGVAGVEIRTLVIDFDWEGEYNQYHMDDETFPGLIEKMEHALENEWAHIREKRNYPDTVKWFTACNAFRVADSGENPFIYGTADKVDEKIDEMKEFLSQWWEIENRDDLLKILPSLLDGRTIKQYKEKGHGLTDEDKRTLWAWDLGRLVYLSSRSYLCDYFAYEESLDWCLKAGLKMQAMFHSWDDFTYSFIRGYALWQDEDPNDEESGAYDFKIAYETYKKLPRNPWNIQWDLTLSIRCTKEW